MIDVDGTNPLYPYYFDVPDCSVGLVEVTENVGITKLFPVSAGNHTANLSARRAAGNRPANFAGRSITVLFVDQNGTGLSMPAISAGAEALGDGRMDGRRR